jgi:hypothetical protein
MSQIVYIFLTNALNNNLKQVAKEWCGNIHGQSCTDKALIVW